MLAADGQRGDDVLGVARIAGITAASTTPSTKRIAINDGMLLTMPVSVAHPPHKTRLQNTSFFTLRRPA